MGEAALRELRAVREEMNRRENRRRTLHFRHSFGIYATIFRPMKYAEESSVKRLLRLEPEKFDGLMNHVRPFLRYRHSKITREERVVVTLDYMLSGQSLHRLSVLYGISLATVSSVIKEVVVAIKDGLSFNVTLPSTEESWAAVANEFYELCKLPHCIGALDGKHIRIKSPANSGSVNFNYKHFFSIHLLAFVDARKHFMFYDIGAAGRNNDSNVFRSTHLYHLFNTNAANLPNPDNLPNSQIRFPYYIAADGAFGLRNWLLKPYAGREHLTREEEVYNNRLSQGRRVVENAFGMLAARFRLLYCPMDLKEETKVRVVQAMVHLHNFLTPEGGAEDSSDPEAYENDLEAEEVEEEAAPVANELRETLTRYFLNEGAL